MDVSIELVVQHVIVTLEQVRHVIVSQERMLMHVHVTRNRIIVPAIATHTHAHVNHERHHATVNQEQHLGVTVYLELVLVIVHQGTQEIVIVNQGLVLGVHQE